MAQNKTELQADQDWNDLSYAIEAGYLDPELDSAYALQPDEYQSIEDFSHE